MANYATSNIRTVALVGQGASGKTTLAEALLLKAGAIKEAGTVERGTTVSDFDPMEKTYQHSLRASVLHLETQDTRIHLVDTPGFPDFIGQAIGALDAVETVAVVVNATAGVEMITNRMMDWAAKRKLCRLIVINKIDAENVDLPQVLASLQAAFGKECLPLNLPADGGKRVVDCFFNPAGEADFSSVAAAHQALVDQVIEVDEELMAKYLEQGDEIAPEQLHAPFEKALREGHLIPVCFVSARTGVGVDELLNVFVKLAPNPAEGNPPLFYKGEGEAIEEFHSEPDPTKHVLAHVFKVVVDPFVGKLGVFRVHQGTVTKDTQLFVGDGRKPFKVGHLFKLQGGKNIEIDKAGPGDIVAVAKVDEIEFDCVLHDSHDEDHIHMRPLEFPTPMHGVAITPKKRGDEQRISDVLHRMIAEDPTLVVEHDAVTNETVLRALGDLHLRSILERMANQYKLEIDTKPPRIPYRETIMGNADGFHRHKKQTGGAGQFGEVSLKVEPRERGAGFEFLDHTKGGVIPHQFLPAVQKGVEQVLASGAIAGFPMQDVRVIVYDGKHHPVDSKEVAFVSAGKKAFLDAVEKAKPTVLEPIVSVEIVCPEANTGDIAGDLSSRRGQVTGTRGLQPGMLAINGLAPLVELEGYSARLKSVTGGHGSWTMQLSHYEAAPPALQQQLVTEFQKQRKHEED
ncbi:MAG: elongation factor G [Betaproteobacteria bacterium]|jgi:elongation factor G|nr:elongation factor G [Betaproteobacteria bacterium]MBK7592859.1 elongation factor G [Betaproteobacteria bacterium]MBK7743466.1 elongation factor G [Betaproteobacteria bacterium]MBK8688490.1 elongation factor G [Betaproteobacteria bacterium]MBL0291230.1 elongation factor G [Betaproteobacteria bacterium]